MNRNRQGAWTYAQHAPYYADMTGVDLPVLVNRSVLMKNRKSMKIPSQILHPPSGSELFPIPNTTTTFALVSQFLHGIEESWPENIK